MSWTGVYRVIWILFLGALAVIGAQRVRQPVSSLPLADRSPDSSVNSILERTLGEPGLAPRISEFLSDLPRGKPILILAAPNDLAASLTADVLSYLAWPRPAAVSADRDAWPGLLGQRYGAIAFCDVAPPPGAKVAKTFGRSLTFLLLNPPE